MSLYNQKQVIFLIREPLTLRDYQRFGIKNWIARGWKVRVFDITVILRPKFWTYVNGDKISYNFKGLKIFKNINEVLSEFSSLKNKVVFIDNIGFSSTEQKIRKLAHSHGVLIRMKLGSIPFYNTKKNIWELFFSIKKPIFFVRKLISFIQNKFENIRSKEFPPDYIVIGGRKSMMGINNQKTSIIKAHNFDYDFFIKKKQIKKKKKNYLLFLDEYGPYHSDFNFFGKKPYVTAKNYYPSIDYALHKIAKSLSLNIKIAAYPRSNYKIKRIKYKYPVIKNKTFQLIRDANIVIGHYSSSLQMAIIMKKPIIFITTDEIEGEYDRLFAKNIYSFATTLGKKAVNINHILNDTDWKDYLIIDNKKYEKYVDNYVKTKRSPKKLIWNTVIEHIENDLFI